jgi:hypothetical protein
MFSPLWERLELVWCWKCNRVTEHEVSFRVGIFAGKYTICKKCRDEVWDPRGY